VALGFELFKNTGQARPNPEAPRNPDVCLEM